MDEKKSTIKKNMEKEGRSVKRFWERSEYFKWGVTAFFVIAASIVFYLLLMRGGAVIEAVSKILSYLSPVIWGLVISYLLWPMTRYFEQKGFRPWLDRRRKKKDNTKMARTLSVMLSIMLALLFIGVLLWIIIPQVYTSIENIVTNAPEYVESATTWIEKLFEDKPELEQAIIQTTGDVSDSLIGWIRSELMPNLSTIVTNVTTGVYQVLRGILDVLIGFVVACYVLFNVEVLGARCKKILYSLFSVSHAEGIMRAVDFTDTTFNGFITGKIIDSLIIGVICYVGCTILKMPYVALVSVIIGVTNLIPVFGPIIGAVPPLLLIFLVSPMKALIFLGFVIVLQQVDGNIIGPKILGSSIGINGFWVVFAILLGGGLFGVLGMLLAVPVFAVIYNGIDRLVDRGLRKRGLHTETADYQNLDHIDPETKQPVKRVTPESETILTSAKTGKK